MSSSQDGRSFRAPAFLRVKPNRPSGAAEYVDERQRAPAVSASGSCWGVSEGGRMRSSIAPCGLCSQR